LDGGAGAAPPATRCWHARSRRQVYNRPTSAPESLMTRLVATILAAGLLALACSPGPAGRSAPPPPDAGGGASSPAPPLKARSAYTTVAVSTSPWWMATEAGYFREQGLDVDMVHLDAGAAL